MEHDDVRRICSPHLTQAQVDALDGAPVLDGEDCDQFIIDVVDGRAVYDAALLEAQDPDWFWFNTVPSVLSMDHMRAPLLRWPDGSFEGDDDEDAG
jgi:hypothetical protein